jgi:hypothetical protein
VPLTAGQVRRLLSPVRPDRIEKVRGMSYVPQFEARAELSRVFGPTNWDATVHDVTLLYEDTEDRNGKTYWRVAYRAACTLVVRDYDGEQLCSYTEYHAEENAPQPSRGEAHALALTSVESYALRRCCINLGDAFGLHLYRDGQLTPLVKGTLLTTDPDSPLYVEGTESPPTPVLTDEQKTVLTNSLGAVPVEEHVA